jgi:hypothetical protein
MIRKLTLAATLAATAIALLAAAAPAAQAQSEEFYVTDNGGTPCWTDCLETGHHGTVDFVDDFDEWFASCDVSFDMEIWLYGEFTLDSASFDNCTGGWTPEIEPCGSNVVSQFPAETYGLGQIVWPDNAPGSAITLEIPFCYGIGTNHYFNRVVFSVSAGPTGLRTLTQAGTAETTHISNIADAVIEDTYSSDNVKLALGTP